MHYTVGAKRRAKKAHGMPELPEGKRLAKRGRPPIQIVEKDIDMPALEARARQMDCTHDEVRAQCMECEAGRAIWLAYRGHKDQADRVSKQWGTWARLDAAEAAYARRYVGISRFPNVAKMELLPEGLEVPADLHADLREPWEKDRDAVNRWMKWQGYLGHLSAGQQTLIQQALRHTGARLVDDARLTDSGKSFVLAVAALTDVVARA